MGWQVLHGAPVVAGAIRPRQQLGIGVRGQDVHAETREALSQRDPPAHGQAEGFLSRGAAGAPDAQPRGMALQGRPGKRRQHLVHEGAEDLPVTVEAGDGDAAQSVQLWPFFRVGFQIALVGLHARARECPHASLDALADLLAHAPKARPAQLQTRQGPLKEGNTLRVMQAKPPALRSDARQVVSGRLAPVRVS